MKLQVLVIATAAAFAAPSFAEEGHARKPLHGGVVSEVRHIDYELVATPSLVQLYVSDHGKAVDLSKATAKVTLLTGADKQDLELKPAGDRLEAPGSFKIATGTKAVAVVTVAGKPSTVRFSLK